MRLVSFLHSFIFQSGLIFFEVFLGRFKYNLYICKPILLKEQFSN